MVLTPLTQDQSVRLLESARTGRLGFHANALPMLLPVDFAMDDGSVVIRVRAGSQVDAATRDAVVAFEADGVDPAEGWEWSVSVTGMATHVSDPPQLRRASALLQDHGTRADDDRFVRVSLDVISGRRSVLLNQRE